MTLVKLSEGLFTPSEREKDQTTRKNDKRTRMHFSRMLTVSSLTVSRMGRVVSAGWGEGVPCDLSHHAFDVTCILYLLQLTLKSNAVAYIVVVM